MTIMRKKIAEHMVSRATSPHVYSVYEVDFHRLRASREDEGRVRAQRHEADLHGVDCQGDRGTPFARSPSSTRRIDGDNIVYKKDINLGIAVGARPGSSFRLSGTPREEPRRAEPRDRRSRRAGRGSKKLIPDEVQGGTFTITNPGVFGAVYGCRLINQPQVPSRCWRHREARGRGQRRPSPSIPPVTCRSATITG